MSRSSRKKINYYRIVILQNASYRPLIDLTIIAQEN